MSNPDRPMVFDNNSRDNAEGSRGLGFGVYKTLGIHID